MNRNYQNNPENDRPEPGSSSTSNTKNAPGFQPGGIEIPTVNLPRGGGAIKGIDEKFQVNSVSGTSSFQIPIPLSPSRHGFVPAVDLSYNSGAGNGVFGLGWDLSVPRITRKTEKFLPQYRDAEESDTFVLSGAEDLIPLLEEDGGEWARYERQKEENGVSFTVRRYRPRIEGLFAVIEKWKNNDTGETHWRSITGNNVHSYYGTTDESRLSDPNDPSRVFEWRLCRTHDDKGNVCLYEYKKEDFDGIENKASEKNRENNCTQTYLKKIFYGNREPFFLGDEPAAEGDFLFKLIFDYGEHDTDEDIPQDIDAEKNSWTCRKDPFSDYRAGFEIRTYRRCSRALVFHCFDEPELPHDPYLVKSLQLFYDDDLDLTGAGQTLNGFSYLTKARLNGHKWDEAANSYSTKFLPEMEFTYQQHEWNTTIATATEDDAANVSIGLDNQNLWIDLFSEGVSGILTERAAGWFYKSNLGDGNFSVPMPVSPKPSFSGLTQGRTSILELEGDGTKYLVRQATEPKGFFKFTEDEIWEPFKNFETLPNLNPGDTNVRQIDLTGDGTADLLFTDDGFFRWYESKGEEGFEISRTVSREIDEEKGPAVLFSDRAQSIFLADINGDGLTDIVRIRNGEICYWSNLGFGKFGAKVTMDNSPTFDHADIFDPKNLRLADIDGSGTIDVVYLGKNDFRVWMNLSGNEWTTEPQIISAFPEIHNLADVSVLDLLGTGTACIVYSSQLPQKAGSAIQFIDLMGSKKPHLMNKFVNNCGKEVSIEYRSSAQFYLDDKKAGRKWITKLPFPVHCISKVTAEDKVRGTIFTTSYSYSHGYYDRAEGEFRGFGRVEQLDTEDFSRFKLNDAKNVVEEELHQPPVKSISWFHTGACFGKGKILNQFKSEYFQNTEFDEYDIPEPSIADDLSADELKEALRALKGMPLRSEVYAEDDSLLSENPYAVTHSTVEIRRLQPKEDNSYACFLVVPSESVSYNYERNPADPGVSHSFVLETDELGNVGKSASVVYPRVERPLGANAVSDKVWEEQDKLHIVYGETLYTDDVIDDADGVYRLRVGYESKSYEIAGIAQPAGFYFEKESLNGTLATASEIFFEVDFTAGVEKRLSSHGRIYFLDEDLTAPLPLGEMSRLGIAHKTYGLAFTKDLVGKYYGTKVTDQMLEDAMYVHGEDDEDWWTQSGETIYSNNPEDNFYTPIGARDIFGNESFAEYDDFTLLVKSVTDAIGNQRTAENDYRTLSPVMITDLNSNRAAVETDELGMVVKSAAMGKDGAGEGDTLDDPTARMEYDLFNWANNQKPNYARAFVREKHGASNPRWQEGYVYSDGGGSVIMTKLQAEPGKAWSWNAVTKQLDETDADPRWVGNGRTIFNNKGNPVKQFEPYFSATHEFESEDALVETGFSAINYYDPVGRNIRTELPDGTFTKVEFDPWHFKLYDVNDTILESQWYIDRGSPDPNAAEPSDAEARAAWLAAKHHDTPGISYLDSLGNPFYAVTDYGSGKTTNVYSESDLTGRFSFVYDQKGRMIAESYTNLLGFAIYGKTAEKGEQWVLTDAMGRLVKLWDNDTREFRTTYDTLHRTVSSFVKEADTEYLYNHILYADNVDDAEPKTLNRKGQVYRIFDQAGSVTIKELDFKGNALEVERRLVQDYKAKIVDWNVLDGVTDLATIDGSADSLLEAEVFTVTNELDALNRPVKVTVPGGTVYEPVYNESNFLDSLNVQILGQGSSVTFLEEQDYDAKGQRQYARYGNGTITEYFYDPKSYRLTNLLTRLSSGASSAQAIQNLFYTFDPVGNITAIRDDAQQTHYFANQVVKPESKFEYDATYRLTKATGREHAGLGGNAQRNHLDLPFIAQLPHVNDADAVRNYTELYEYDDCGNIMQMQHIAANANWTKRYRYEYETDATNNTNRLKATSTDGDPEGVFSMNYVHDSQGNMTSMPHLSAPDSLIWNFMAQLKEVNLGGGGTAYYVYGMGGNRIRKVIERLGGLVQERIYLGAVEIYRERQGANDPNLERHTVHVSDNAGKIAQVDIKTIDENNSDPANPLNTNLIRYQYANHLGSASIETDDAGNVISYEEYHPYGTSAYRVSKSNVDLSLKRYRFSGKERDDETGFYYFGARYYAPWLGRWTSSDPSALAAGFNLYRYCANNPIIFYDPNGMDETKTPKTPYSIGHRFTGQESLEEMRKFLWERGKVMAEPDINETNYKTRYTPGKEEGGAGGVWHFDVRSTKKDESYEGAYPAPPAPEGGGGETPTPTPPAEPTPAPEAPAETPAAEDKQKPDPATATHVGPGVEKFIWNYRFKGGLNGASQRGFILQNLYTHNPRIMQRDNVPNFDQETGSRVKQIKSTNAKSRTIENHASKATNDAARAVRNNQTGSMNGKRPQAVIISPTDAPASVAADINRGYQKVRAANPTSLPPEHVRGLPGAAGVVGKGLTFAGAGLSAYSLYGDIQRGDVPMGIGDSLGVVGGGLEIYAIASPGAAVAGVSAMTAGLAVGGVGISVTSGVSAYRAFKAGDNVGGAVGVVGVGAGAAITAGAIGVAAGVAAAPVVLAVGIVAAVGVGVFHAGRYFDWW